MKCKCGYEGWAEIGQFEDERFGGKYKSMLVTFRCPSCKTNKNVIHINAIDSIREALRFPRTCCGVKGETKEHSPIKQVVTFIEGGADTTTVGYSIHCPFCHWGHGSIIPKEDFERLKSERIQGQSPNEPMKAEKPIPFAVMQRVNELIAEKDREIAELKSNSRDFWKAEAIKLKGTIQNSDKFRSDMVEENIKLKSNRIPFEKRSWLCTKTPSCTKSPKSA
jgi:rubredoxin